MARYKVLAISETEEYRLSIKNRLAPMENIALVGFASAGQDLSTKIKGYAPHAVLIVQEDGNNVFEVAQSIYQGFPGCAIVLLVESLSVPIIKAAMQAGVRDVIIKTDMEELESTLLRAAQSEQSRGVSTRPDPRVISIFSGRGGTGRTTIAMNSAVALANAGQRTILVDLNLAFGDAPLLLNIKSKDTIAELVQEKNIFNIDDIRSFMMQHPSGVSVLCSPISPEHAEYVTAAHVELLINQLRPYYDFIVIDLPSDISETTLTAVECSDLLVMVSRRNLSGLRTTKQMIAIFKMLDQGDKIRLLLNANNTKSALSLKDMERVFELPFSYILPDDTKTVQSCAERGTSFITDAPRSQISKAMTRLAQLWIEDSLNKETEKEAKAK